jgi:STAS domain
LRYALRERFRSRPGLAPGMLTVSPLAGRAGLRLDGEADLTSQDELQKAFAALPPGAAEIHFELAGLTFIDVAATRMLIARTRQPPHPRLILHHPPPSLQRLFHLLWPDSNAQFRFSPDNGSQEEPVPGSGSARSLGGESRDEGCL